MVALKELVQFIDTYLKSGEFKDYAPNGLQVEGRPRVRKLVTGVSACVELFDRALEKGADAVLCHHGLLWEGQPRTLIGSRRERMALLLKNELSLLAYHLPLDAHPDVGNNAQLAKALHLRELKPFAEVKGREIGFLGTLEEATPRDSFFSLVRNTINSGARFHPFGPAMIRSVAVCSGGAPEMLSAAVEAGADLYLTGEETEWIHHLAKEERIHFAAAGHHATERFGVRALGEFLSTVRELELEVEFIDVENPV